MSEYSELITYIKQLERRLAKLERIEGSGGGGVTDHGGLTGLTDDDHTQYLLASVPGGRATFATNWTDLTDAGATTLHKHDHGGSDGLTDDDHSQYARLAGRSGGQALVGGTGANDDLTLEGTSHATRTTSYVNLQPNGGNVGVGVAAPLNRLHIVGADDENSVLIAGASKALRFQPKSTVMKIEAVDHTGVASYQPLQIGGSTFSLSIGSSLVATLDASGNFGVGDTTPDGKIDAAQTSTTAAIPTLVLEQSDLSEEFIQFDTTVGAGNPVDTAALGTYYGKIRVSVNGTFRYMALYNT